MKVLASPEGVPHSFKQGFLFASILRCFSHQSPPFLQNIAIVCHFHRPLPQARHIPQTTCNDCLQASRITPQSWTDGQAMSIRKRKSPDTYHPTCPAAWTTEGMSIAWVGRLRSTTPGRVSTESIAIIQTDVHTHASTTYLYCCVQWY